MSNRRIAVAVLTDRGDLRDLFRAYEATRFSNKYDLRVYDAIDDAKAWLLDETGDEALREL